MQILNPAVLQDLQAGRKLSLNLGCGRRRVPGHYGVDLVPLPEVDIVSDLSEPLSALPADCVAAVTTRHTLEHVPNLLGLLTELHRVCCPDARIEVIVPHYSNPYGYSDPTHVRFFGVYSFFYFADERDQPQRKVPAFYLPQRFRVESVRLRLLKESLLNRLVRSVVEPLLNRGIGWLDWYERRLCRLLPASEIRYVLRVVKDAEVRSQAA